MASPRTLWSFLPLFSLAACSLSTSDYTFDGGGGAAGASTAGAAGASGGHPGAGQAGASAGGAGATGAAGEGGAGQSGAGGAGQSGAGGAGQSGAGQSGAGKAGASGAGQSGAGQAGAAGSGPCNAGDKRCNGADIEACVGGVFKQESTCEAGQTCAVQAGVPACTNCAPDQGKCAGATLLRCASDGSNLALVDTCAGATPICDEKGNGGKGECDKCVPDALQCVGPILFKCAANGQSLILSKDCGSASLCDATAGACKTEVCKAGERACANDTPVACDTAQNKLVADGPACPPGLCNPASNQCFACKAGEYRCDADALQTCTPDGSKWSTVTQCPAGKCDATAKTCTQCSPGTRICVGQTIVECLGGSFSPGTTITTCDPARICDAVGSQCDVCQPGAFRCDGAALKQCDPNGQTEVVKDTCQTAAQCDPVAAACKACSPGTYRCTGATLEKCADDGSAFVTSDTCATAALCDANARACQPPVCAVDDKPCGAGNQAGVCNPDRTGITFTACPATQACVPGGGCQSARSLATGLGHACAVIGDSVFCWGNNGLGQCGDPPVGAIPPTPVKLDSTGAILGDVTAIAAGHAHTCAIRKSQVYCWGDNAYGQLGTGTPAGTSSFPQPVALGKVVKLFAGGNSTCAVNSSDELWCWGRNDRGQLGVGDAQQRNTPVRVTGLTGTLLELSMSARTTCATAELMGQNQVWCWGDNTYGQAGAVVGTQFVTPQLIKVFEATHIVTSADLSSAVTCAHSGDKTYCWGSNSQGEQGKGASGMQTSSPSSPVTGVSDVTSMASNYPCTCAALSKSTVCWGHCAAPEMAGQLSGTSFPTPVALGTAQLFAQISMGQTWGCGLRKSGELACWGRNNLQQLGSPGANSVTPRAVVFP